MYGRNAGPFAELQDRSTELTEKLLKQLSNKNKDKYQYILKAGKSFHNLLFLLYRKVWDSEVKPSSWKKTVCHQLFKGKGEKKEFGNQRFIHTKEDIPKAFEQIVITRAKPAIIKHCTKFQIGSIPKHQPAEHLFTIKSIISYYQILGIMLILQCYDIKKYFDSENLKDTMNSLYNYGVNGNFTT